MDRLKEEGLVLVATLSASCSITYMVLGSRASSTRRAVMTPSGVGKPEVMTVSNQLAHALVYQVTVCQSPHGPCASLLGVLV